MPCRIDARRIRVLNDKLVSEVGLGNEANEIFARGRCGLRCIRDPFGTLLNEGSANGILVATSGYGKSAFEFANNKPIELVSGANLLYLLEKHANVDAKIEFPDEWVDP